MSEIRPILERRSCRTYLDKEVPEDVLKQLLMAGMVAPSAMNSQPWEFLVMQEPEKKAKVSNLVPYWNMLAKAPLGILIMANLDGYRASTRDFFMQDCAASTENILLAAEALGLGGVWLGLYPKMDKVEAIRKIYNIPEDILPFSLLSLGYPIEHARPHNTFRKHKVHHDQY